MLHGIPRNSISVIFHAYPNAASNNDLFYGGLFLNEYSLLEFQKIYSSHVSNPLNDSLDHQTMRS